MDLQDIPEKRKLKALRNKDSLYSFYEKVKRAVKLVNFAEGSKSKKIISESRRQFIIAIVTALEVYISDVVAELINKNRKIKSNLNSLCGKKFSLQDIYFIKKEDISIGDLVVLDNNFQNINEIGKLLSVMFEINFFEFLKANKFYYQNTQGKEESFIVPRNIYKKLESILKSRHKFVHDITFKNTPPYNELAEARSIIYDFVHSIEILSNHITKKRINRFEGLDRDASFAKVAEIPKNAYAD